MASKNSNLHTAKKNKNDEFYTQLSDIEKEMKYYKDAFKGKVVYCNCDDARESNFFKYFSMNFEHLGLKRLITTSYSESGKGNVLVYEGDKNGNRRVDDEEIKVTELQGNGDFASDECTQYLKQADIVVTNPPFSLFREYVKQLMDYNKKFIIIGNQNAITYKEIFPYIKEDKLWMGYKSGDMAFTVPDYYEAKETRYWVDENGQKWRSLGNVCWFTNVEHDKRNTPLDLYKTYNPKDYPTYDNYDAIEVSKVAEIPSDYDGVMGVPITFLDKYCPTQFEIIGITENANYLKDLYLDGCEKYDRPYLNGKRMYSRLLIKRIVSA